MAPCKNLLSIARDCFGWRDVKSWSSCLHQALKALVVYYFERSHTLSHPANNLHADNFISMWIGRQTGVYHASALVCCLCEYVTLPLPLRCSNIAIIDPSGILMDFLTISQAVPCDFAASAAVTASSPQHIFAWQQRLLVDFPSVVSRYLQTCHWFMPLPLQDLALHSKTWTHCAGFPT